MKLQITLATILTVLSASAVAQEDLPPCSLQCIQSAITITQCNVQDIACICASGTIFNDTSKCVGSCDPNEREQAMGFVQAQLCSPTAVPDAEVTPTADSAAPTDTPEVLRRQDKPAPPSTDTPTNPAPTDAAPADSAPTDEPSADPALVYEIPVDSGPTGSDPVDPTPANVPAPDPRS